MTGKVAFVTGAASGIGRATAQLFAARGYSVALADISQAGLDETAANIAKAGGASASFVCDVADDASVKAAVEAGAVGGGFVGLEVAASAVKKGVHVTVLEAAGRLGDLGGLCGRHHAQSHL